MSDTKTVNFSLRINPEVKRQSEAIFNELGISLTSAINSFLKQSIRVGGIPFDMKLSEPNKATILALLEAEALENGEVATPLEVEEALTELKHDA